jgi:hypothetical protein
MVLLRSLHSKLQAWKRVLLASVVVYGVLVILYEYRYEEVKGLFAPLLPEKYASKIAGEKGEWQKVLAKFSSVNSLRPIQTRVLPRIQKRNDSIITIAIGLAITSRRIKKMAIDNMGQKHPFFMSLLPSFCKTMSRGFSYSFYLAYDYSDNFFANSQFREVFHQKFGNITTNLCPFANDSSVDLKLVKCSYQRKPARAQNDAMLEAYLDGKRYFYRVNDDTVMISKNWTEFLIEALRNMKPPYVGVVGPVQKGKNILTYDFVHRTHVDIFGYYYPHFFTD